MREPVIQIMGQAGKDLVGRWRPSLVSVSLVDHDGGEADELTIVFAVDPPFPPVPPKNTPYACAFGWRGGPLRDAGSFTVQSTSISGDAESGYLLTVTCRSADFDKLKEMGSGHFEDTTAGDIIKKIASEAGLSAKVDETIGATKIPYRLRWAQSSGGFITELAGDLGGTMKVANKTLLVSKRNSGKTAGGSDMPTIKIDFSETGPIELTIEGRPEFKESSSGWFDPLEGLLKFVDGTSVGDAARLMLLHPAASEDEAKKAGEAQAAEQARSSVSGSITIEGRIDALAGAPVSLTGFGGDADGLPLVAPTITHDFTFDDSGGWLTTVELESRKTE